MLLDKNTTHDTALKQYEDQMNSKVRRLEAKISELQRSNDDFLHLKVNFKIKKTLAKILIDSSREYGP